MDEIEEKNLRDELALVKRELSEATRDFIKAKEDLHAMTEKAKRLELGLEVLHELGWTSGYAKQVLAGQHPIQILFERIKQGVQVGAMRAHARVARHGEREVSVLDGPGEGTWSVFAFEVVEERDDLREKVAEQAKRIEKLRASAEMYRARLKAVMPWVGGCPYPNTAPFTEMILVKELAEDALEEEIP